MNRPGANDVNPNGDQAVCRERRDRLITAKGCRVLGPKMPRSRTEVSIEVSIEVSTEVAPRTADIERSRHKAR